MNTGEPFGLPKGTVRGILALGFSGAVIFQWLTGAPVPNEELAVATLIVGNYFGTRSTSADAPAPEPPLAAPFVPGDETGD